MRAMSLWLQVLAALVILFSGASARELAQAQLPPLRRLQVSIAVEGTCQDADLNGFNQIFSDSVVADVRAFTSSNVRSTTVPTCRNVKSTDASDTRAFASFIARVQWRSTTANTQLALFQNANRLRTACRVGISADAFPAVLDAVEAAGKTIVANAASRAGAVMPYVTPCNRRSSSPRPSPSPSPAPVSVDCVGSWSDYSACNVTACGQSGFQTSTYNVTTPAANGGKQCEAKQGDVRLLACNTTACPPPPANCTLISDSQLDAAENKCKCIKTGFTIPALDKDGLINRCLADNTASCPTSHPVAVRDNSGATVRLMSCLTADSSCPAPYTFPLWGGSPSVLKECRTPMRGCGYQGYGMPVFDGLNTVDPVQLGCVDATTNACPFVAFRAADRNWALDECRRVTTCRTWGENSKTFTVPAYSNAGSLMSCLTLGSDNACPESSPLEVTTGSKLGCGSGNNQCDGFNTGASRTVQCLSSNASCPPSHGLELFKVTGNPAKTELVQCREARQTCDFTAAGMGGAAADVNAGVYDVKITRGDVLAGCILSAPTACPEKYSRTTRVNGVITECRPADGTQITCPENNPIPVRDTAGVVVDCQPISGPCPADYPVTVRTGTLGKVACLAPGSSCPGDYNFGFFAPSADGKSAVLSNCFRRADIVVSTNPTCSVTIPAGSGPSGTTGSYSRPIRSNSTGTLELLGCMLDSISVCPTGFPFSLYTGPQLTECRSAVGNTGCAADQKPAKDQGVLVGCVSTDNANCPAAFPVEVMSGSTLLECITSTSTCSQTTQTFSIVEGEALITCVAATAGQSECTGDNAGLEIFSPSGNNLVGCVKAGTKCPKLFPITFFQIGQNGDTAESCRAGLAGTCSEASQTSYPITLFDADSKVAGCIKAGATGCGGSNRVIVADTATGSPVACYPDATTGCTLTGYTFPLYGGSTADKLERCIKPVQPAATSCATFGAYTAAIFSTTDGTGSVAGCIKDTTPCPTGAPVAFLAADSKLAQCRPAGVVTCSDPYRIRLEPNASSLLGCMASAATSCPSGGAVNAPFLLYGSNGLGADRIDACRMANAAVTDCSGEPNYPVKIHTAEYANNAGGFVGCKSNSAFCPTVGADVTVMTASPDASGAMRVEGCYKKGSNGVGCPSGRVPLCDDSTVQLDNNNAVTCTANKLRGCVSLPATNNRCPTSLTGSPVTYPVFVSDITPNTAVASAAIQGCFRRDTACPAATFNTRAHDGSTPSATVAGCTDGAQGDCQTYWRAYKVAARGDEVCSTAT